VTNFAISLTFFPSLPHVSDLKNSQFTPWLEILLSLGYRSLQKLRDPTQKISYCICDGKKIWETLKFAILLLVSSTFSVFVPSLCTRVSTVRLHVGLSEDVQFRRIYILKVAATQASETDFMKIKNTYHSFRI
jgi:hypothetical protein